MAVLSTRITDVEDLCVNQMFFVLFFIKYSLYCWQKQNILLCLNVLPKFIFLYMYVPFCLTPEVHGML